MDLPIEDQLKLSDLIARCMWALDFGDPNAYASCFAPDGELFMDGIPEGASKPGLYRGRDELQSHAATVFNSTAGHVRHWNSNSVLNGSGDHASAESYVVVIRVGQFPLAGIISTGIHRDTFQKFDGEWKIVRRTFVCDPQPEHTKKPSHTMIARRDAFIMRSMPSPRSLAFARQQKE